jgi:hypothetical protein
MIAEEIQSPIKTLLVVREKPQGCFLNSRMALARGSSGCRAIDCSQCSAG